MGSKGSKGFWCCDWTKYSSLMISKGWVITVGEIVIWHVFSQLMLYHQNPLNTSPAMWSVDSYTVQLDVILPVEDSCPHFLSASLSPTQTDGHLQALGPSLGCLSSLIFKISEFPLLLPSIPLISHTFGKWLSTHQPSSLVSIWSRCWMLILFHTQNFWDSWPFLCMKLYPISFDLFSTEALALGTSLGHHFFGSAGPSVQKQTQAYWPTEVCPVTLDFTLPSMSLLLQDQMSYLILAMFSVPQGEKCRPESNLVTCSGHAKW